MNTITAITNAGKEIQIREDLIVKDEAAQKEADEFSKGNKQAFAMQCKDSQGNLMIPLYSPKRSRYKATYGWLTYSKCIGFMRRKDNPEYGVSPLTKAVPVVINALAAEEAKKKLYSNSRRRL